jgi:chemotaxis response regulator CheB
MLEAELLGVKSRSALTLEDFALQYKEHAPNIIVLDVVIGNGDASQAVEFLAKNKSTAAIFVVSGYSARIAGTIAGMARDHGLMVADTINKNADGIRRLMAGIKSYMVH